jgi:hypothetical protein
MIINLTFFVTILRYWDKIQVGESSDWIWALLLSFSVYGKYSIKFLIYFSSLLIYMHYMKQEYTNL